MIGLIITGNGKFPEGVSSAVEILSGKLEDYATVSFLLEETVDQFINRLRTVIESMKQSGNILIMADVLDSTTYREACTLANMLRAKLSQKLAKEWRMFPNQDMPKEFNILTLPYNLYQKERGASWSKYM